MFKNITVSRTCRHIHSYKLNEINQWTRSYFRAENKGALFCLISHLISSLRQFTKSKAQMIYEIHSWVTVEVTHCRLVHEDSTMTVFYNRSECAMPTEHCCKNVSVFLCVETPLLLYPCFTWFHQAPPTSAVREASSFQSLLVIKANLGDCSPFKAWRSLGLKKCL